MISLAAAALLMLAPAAHAAPAVAVSSGAGEGYSWTMRLPVLGLPSADAALRYWADKQLADFLGLCKDPRVGQPGPWQFALTGSVFPPAPDAVSVQLKAWSYAGGAHGVTQSETFTWLKEGERRLSLADLFKPGAPYLRALSRRAAPELERRLGRYADADWLAKGTAPTTENYAEFALTGDDLLILFPTYQVAPYVAGPQAVRVPLKDLRPLLRPAFGGR